MSESKVWKWMKLYSNFFKSHEVTILDSMKDGHEMVLFYLKILCESVQYGGELRFSPERGYTVEELALLTRTDDAIAIKADKALQDLRLIKWESNGTLVFLKAGEMIGAETDNARRVRKWRQLHKSEPKPKEPVTPTLQSNKDVTPSNVTDTLQTLHEKSSPLTTSQLRVQETNESLRDEKKSPSSSSTESSAPAKGDNGDMAEAMAEEFYEAYPKKSGIEPVKEAFLAMGMTRREYGGMMLCLDRYKASQNWTKLGGRFVPLPETWLSRKPWTEADCEDAERKAKEAEWNRGAATQASGPEPDAEAVPLPDIKTVGEALPQATVPGKRASR